MNVWKVSTIVLASGMAFIVGKGLVTTAGASTDGASHTDVGYDWGAEQPHMQRALDDLRKARHSLEAASEHKGGWRVAAIGHTDAAIQATVDGMEYARHHTHDE